MLGCWSDKLGIDRQGQGLAGRPLALGEVALAVAEIGEALLHVQRDRIVDFVADLLLFQIRLQLVAARHADDELVVDVAVAGHFVRQLHQARSSGQSRPASNRRR